jgi:tryptophanase
MFALADAAVMSIKKDGLVNMGGFLALRDHALSDACTNLLIITEGFATYGGLSGRDMEAIAVGLEEVFEADYLHYRIRSTAYLGERIRDRGVPVIFPSAAMRCTWMRRGCTRIFRRTSFPGRPWCANCTRWAASARWRSAR